MLIRYPSRERGHITLGVQMQERNKDAPEMREKAGGGFAVWRLIIYSMALTQKKT